MTKKYDDSFKEQIVAIYNQGKHSCNSLATQYDISVSTVRKWVLRYNASNSFDINDSRSAEELELIKLRKHVKQLEMENDILKQAALLLGKK